MNKDASILLLKIIAKEPEALTKDDISFLKARITYVPQEDLERFASVLSDKPVAKPVSEPVSTEATVSYKDLLAKAKAMGLKVRIGMKKEIIEAMIADAQ